MIKECNKSSERQKESSESYKESSGYILIIPPSHAKYPFFNSIYFNANRAKMMFPATKNSIFRFYFLIAGRYASASYIHLVACLNISIAPPI